jgi:peptidyl-prolyl cis-trans isomerase B (cyclophilin B)
MWPTSEEGAEVAGKKERQRKLARERLARQQARRAARARRWRQGSMIGGALAVLAALGTGAYFLFFNGSSGSPASAASASATPSASAAATAAMVNGKCVYTASGTASRKAGTPPATPAKVTSYQATITTNRGPVVVDLQAAKAPCTVNSFVYLAAKHYFDSTPCHRLTTAGIYVLQCGDPSGTGSGGPGYKFGNENLTGARYTQGTLAMANAGPGTNGSQFFIVYRDSLTLPASYTPFGKVVKGLGIIQNVAKAGSDNANGQGDGHPRDKVTIQSVTIKGI